MLPLADLPLNVTVHAFQLTGRSNTISISDIPYNSTVRWLPHDIGESIRKIWAFFSHCHSITLLEAAENLCVAAAHAFRTVSQRIPSHQPSSTAISSQVHACPLVFIWNIYTCTWIFVLPFERRIRHSLVSLLYFFFSNKFFTTLF